MKKYRIIFGVVVIALLALTIVRSDLLPQRAKGGKRKAAVSPAPVSLVKPIKAAEFKKELEAHRGEVILVNLWATWCKPCVKELPDLVRLQQAYKDKKFTVVAVSLDDLEDLRKTVNPFVAQNMPDLVNYLQNDADPEKFVGIMDPTWEGIVPTSFVFDRSGKMVTKLLGGKKYEEFEAAIKPLLEQP
ncbi:MAG: TlpA family protein disulfide reductase [Blastocatellia bacterium]